MTLGDLYKALAKFDHLPEDTPIIVSACCSQGQTLSLQSVYEDRVDSSSGDRWEWKDHYETEQDAWDDPDNEPAVLLSVDW